jgi:deoxyribonuclease-4
MRLGCHLSIAKGFAAAVDEAASLDTTALQLFSHNASTWRMKDITAAAAAGFRERVRASPLEAVVVHTMYLLNLASPDDDLYEKSVAALVEEVERARLLGVDLLVTHLGSHRGSGVEVGVARIASALDRVVASGPFRRHRRLTLLFENTAGAGSSLGGDFAELGEILRSLEKPGRVGVCLDTCHALAFGYELRSRDGIAKTLRDFDREVGLARLAVVHLNDSVFPKGSHRDRHEHLGRGAIGREGLSLLVNHPSLRDLPFLLETPKDLDGRPDADRVNLDLVRSWRHDG